MSSILFYLFLLFCFFFYIYIFLLLLLLLFSLLLVVIVFVILFLLVFISYFILLSPSPLTDPFWPIFKTIFQAQLVGQSRLHQQAKTVARTAANITCPQAACKPSCRFLLSRRDRAHACTCMLSPLTPDHLRYTSQHPVGHMPCTKASTQLFRMLHIALAVRPSAPGSCDSCCQTFSSSCSRHSQVHLSPPFGHTTSPPCGRPHPRAWLQHADAHTSLCERPCCQAQL